jgi:PTS system nitrogen regulatory IIA component
MTTITELLVPEAVLSGVSVASKKALFAALGATAAEAYGLDARAVSETLSEREKLGSTGFGAGIAIPHGKLDAIRRVCGVFLPVDLVFMLLSPVGAGAEHLKALACVSRCLRDKAIAAKLRGAGSRDALYALLAGVEARDAA